MTPAKIAILVGLLSVTVVCGRASWGGHVVYWRGPEHIEAHLLERTPLGTSESDVLDWLSERSPHYSHRRIPLKPGEGSIPTRIGGSSFVHALIAQYRAPLHVSVEVSYVFDASARLVEIRVRKTVDGT